MSYYKTKNPDVLHARQQYLLDCRRVQLEGEAFAHHFPGSRPVFFNDLGGRSFSGLNFEAQPDLHLWELRGQGGYIPRCVPAVNTPEELRDIRLDEIAALRARWAAERPYFLADMSRLMGQLGVSLASHERRRGYHCFDGVDGWFYFHVSAAAAPYCVEIMGCEYRAAEDAMTAALGERTTRRREARML